MLDKMISNPEKSTNLKTLVNLFLITLSIFFYYSVSAQSEGDFRSNQSGKWNSKQTWQIFKNGSWGNANHAPGNSKDATVTIRNGHVVTYNTNNVSIFDLIVDQGGQLYRNATGNEKSLSINHNIVCDGTIGNGSTIDCLTVDFDGESMKITGNGLCSFYKIVKNSNTYAQSELVIDMDVELTTSTDASISNAKNNTNLNIVLNPGKNLTTHSTIDLINGNSNSNKTCNLYIKANEADCGSLITPDVEDSDASNTTVENYLNENKWHYICSPVDDPLASTFNNIYLMQFDEPSGQWSYITDPDQVLSQDMQGLAAWTSSALVGNTTLQFNGTLNTGYHEIGLTFTGNATHNHRGFNFVGNPYTSALDWDYSGENGWTKTGIDDAIYLWNGDAGGYGSYVNGFSVNGASNIIPAHQGFYVHCNQPTGTLGVNSGAQVHNHKAFLKSGNAEEQNVLRIKASGNGYTDETLIHFDENSSDGYDKSLDALKITGLDDAPQIYSLTGEDDFLSINSLPATDIVQLGFSCSLPGIYTLDGEGQFNFDNNTDIYLEDLVTGETINLKEQSSYNFSYQENENVHRFNIRFYGPNAIEKNKVRKVNVYAFNNEIHIQNGQFNNAEVCVFNTMGQKLAEQKIGTGTTTIKMNVGGCLIVELNSGNYFQTNKVMVK